VYDIIRYLSDAGRFVDVDVEEDLPHAIRYNIKMMI
jgi:hypothetical protein